MIALKIIVISICALGLIWCVYMLYRNEMTHRFYLKVLYKNVKLYDKLPNYFSVANSFEPLKYESFFTEEEIKQLESNQ